MGRPGNGNTAPQPSCPASSGNNRGVARTAGRPARGPAQGEGVWLQRQAGSGDKGQVRCGVDTESHPQPGQ